MRAVLMCGSGLGDAASSACVYGCSGRANSSSVVRDFHHAAQVQHHHAVAQVFHHVQVVRDEQHGQAESRSRRSHSRLTTCAWMDTSSADTRLVGHDEFGLHRQRAGHADALALAAGELVRESAPAVVGVQAHPLQQFGDTVCAPPVCPWPGRACAAPRPGCRAPASCGFRLAYGSWNTICSLLRSARMRLRFSWCRCRGRGTAMRPAGGVEQAQQRAADGGLARAGFADQAQRCSPRLDGEGRDAVHRAHRLALPRPRMVVSGLRLRTSGAFRRTFIGARHIGFTLSDAARAGLPAA